MSLARTFAIQAHGTQKYGEAPYETHLSQVVAILTAEGYAVDPDLVSAAWLHDVVEDTDISIDQIEEKFGQNVSEIVYRVTDEPGADRKARKLLTYPKIKGHQGATIIKLCDRIANVEASFSVPKKLNMYLGEFVEFRNQVYVPKIADNLWDRLDRVLLEGLKKSSQLPFFKEFKCQNCGKKASSIEITHNCFLIYSGPGGSSGDQGNKVDVSRALNVIEALKNPDNAQALKNQFYDKCGYCSKCQKFYCGGCWNISSIGFGECVNGHSEAMDPHWSPPDH